MPDVKLHAESPGRALGLSQHGRGADIARVLEDSHPGELWDNLFEQPQLLPHHFRAHRGEPGDVAAGSRHAGDEARCNRVAYDSEDDRDCAGRLLGRFGSRRGRGNDDIHLQAHELSGERWQPLRPTLCEAVLDHDGLTLDIAQLSQALPKGLENYAVRRGQGREVPDVGHLRLGGERRGEEAASHCADECPPRGHWITSSARSSSDGGIVRPSALAVLRLMTSSNFVGCSIGRSRGWAPLRILST